MKASYPHKSEHAYSLLRWQLLRLFNSGITTTEDYAGRNDIRVMNLVCVVCAFSTFLMALLFCLFRLFSQSFACLGTSLFFILPFYLNSKGQHLLCKIITTIFINSSLLVWSCIFTHQSVLNVYFFFMATVCIYLYRRAEGRWIFISIFFSLACFVMESTHLKTLLPALDLIHESKQLIITNYILLTGLIFLLITNVGCFVFLSGLREQKLSDTKKMLIGSRKKLATQNRDLKSFGAAASHFLQTPLYVSRLFLGKLKAGREEKSDAGAQRYFEMIDESLNQMEDFIKGFFAHYKIMEINSKNEQVDVLAELIRIKEVLLQKFPLAVISLPDEKIKLNTNRLLLIIILQNVMENGLKYNKSKLPEMEVSIIRINTTYSFLFTDNGIGIGQPFIETIFNPFVRIDHHTSEGTGLGLTGAKRAAEAINGELFCESSDGNGSTFRLNIDDRDLLKKI